MFNGYLHLVQGNTPSEIRDHAMLLVIAVYGVRSGEVRHLRLEDIDWEREILCIRRPKQRKTQHYPLVREGRGRRSFDTSAGCDRSACCERCF